MLKWAGKQGCAWDAELYIQTGGTCAHYEMSEWFVHDTQLYVTLTPSRGTCLSMCSL